MSWAELTSNNLILSKNMVSYVCKWGYETTRQGVVEFDASIGKSSSTLNVPGMESYSYYIVFYRRQNKNKDNSDQQRCFGQEIWRLIENRRALGC